MADLTELARLVDNLLDDDAVVFGSTPEDARDLDILCSGPAAKALGATLDEAGFRHRGDTWLRIVGGRSWVVDVTRTDGADMPQDLAAAVAADSVALPGFVHLRRPAPHHAILLLAWRLVPPCGAVKPSHASRIRAAVVEDPHAWNRAAADATRLGLAGQLDALRAAVEHGPTTAAGPRRRGGWRPAAGRVLARHRSGGVVAVSGVDGAGKSTQTTVLAEALEALGYRTDVKWTRITYDPALERVARPVKAALALVHGRHSESPRPAPAEAEEATGAAEPEYDERGNEIKLYIPHPGTSAARSLRQRSRMIAGAWATVIAFADARALRRTTLPQVRRGVVVIRDRYALDSVVQLLDQYGPRHRLQSRIIAGLAPRPLRAFLLDVPATTAWTRKPEEYDVEQLERHRRGYLARAEQLGVTVVDADREADAISTELVMQVWDALR